MLRLPEPIKAMESPCSFLLPHSVPCVSFAGNRLSSGLHLLGHGEFKLCLRPRSLSGSFHRSSMFSRMALGPNVSEDTDDMFDELFKKYGKVVFKRNDQKAPSAEVDDDAESLSFAIAVAKVASDVKAADIRVLFVKPLVYWTRFFIIATAFSRPQIDAIGTKIKDLAEKQYGKVATGDAKPNSWTLLDFVNNGDDPCAVVAMIDFLLVCIFFAECIWQATWLSTFFFLHNEHYTTWRSSMATRHPLNCLSKTSNPFAAETLAEFAKDVKKLRVMATEAGQLKMGTPLCLPASI